jgi:hypothetical protein
VSYDNRPFINARLVQATIHLSPLLHLELLGHILDEGRSIILLSANFFRSSRERDSQREDDAEVSEN